MENNKGPGNEAFAKPISRGSVGNIGKMAEGSDDTASRMEILAQFQVAMSIIFRCLVYIEGI